MYDIFNAFKYTPYSKVKAVILGQDPYHGANQAHGLCFSVMRGIVPPPSLKNIYKELQSEFDFRIPSHGTLTDWAEEGVLLLNTTLTVRDAQPMSHKGRGWEIFTDEVIKKLNDSPLPIVFLLWGAHARTKKALITNKHHLILESAHPSPLSAHNGFFGNGHFRRANEFLVSQGIEPIDWSIKE